MDGTGDDWGRFAGCGQREFRAVRGETGALPLDPAIFLKSSKTFIFCLNTCHYPTEESVWKGPL